MTGQLRLIAVVLLVLAPLTNVPAAMAGQRFTIFYTNDTLGETEPCG